MEVLRSFVNEINSFGDGPLFRTIPSRVINLESSRRASPLTMSLWIYNLYNFNKRVKEGVKFVIKTRFRRRQWL